jgi:membrane fusion protein (multidrug efflux system)
MYRFMFRHLCLLAALAAATACSRARGESAEAAPAAPAPIPVTSVAAVEQPIARFLQVTGTLAAEEQADVAAETAGRVVATPVERGTPVGAGGPLVRLDTTELAAQADEANANAAQIEARLGLSGNTALDMDRVPEVANARASLTLAESEFTRARQLVERQLLSRSEFDQKSAEAEVARRQYDIARNSAAQQYQALVAARARVTLARKAVDDAVVRAPFAGVVGERLVSVGDYVTRGTKVASVLRTDPLRVELTVPEQFAGEVAVGRPVALRVESHPGETFTGRVRYMSPAVSIDSRALVVEAVVPNPGSRLKPGSFVTARIEQASQRPAILIPASAVRASGATSRVYVIAGDRAEERIVTLGDTTGERVEVVTGLRTGEQVAIGNQDRLTDGAAVSVTPERVPAGAGRAK